MARANAATGDNGKPARQPFGRSESAQLYHASLSVDSAWQLLGYLPSRERKRLVSNSVRIRRHPESPIHTFQRSYEDIRGFNPRIGVTPCGLKRAGENCLSVNSQMPGGLNR